MAFDLSPFAALALTQHVNQHPQIPINSGYAQALVLRRWIPEVTCRVGLGCSTETVCSILCCNYYAAVQREVGGILTSQSSTSPGYFFFFFFLLKILAGGMSGPARDNTSRQIPRTQARYEIPKIGSLFCPRRIRTRMDLCLDSALAQAN